MDLDRHGYRLGAWNQYQRKTTDRIEPEPAATPRSTAGLVMGCFI